MMTSKDFHIGDILSAGTGTLVSPAGIGAIYEVLNFMTGESLYTHQLPRVSREAGPVILRQHPELAQAYEEVKQVTPDNWEQWLATWVGRYGAALSISPMTEDEHARIDMMSELVEMVHPDKIIPVVID
jgi:hypothetical protein